MLDEMHQPPAEVVARAYVDAEGYARMYADLDRRPGRLLGRAGAPARLDQALHPGQEHVVRLPRRLDQVVRGRQAQRLGELHRPPPRDPRRPDRDHLGERRPERLRAHQLSPAARRGLEARQRAADHGRQEGRPRRPLPADDPGGGLRDARLRADRGGALGGLRRLLGRRAALAGRGLGRQARHHRRRGAARRPPDAAQGQCRQGGRRPRRREAAGRASHRRRGALGRGARHLAARGDGDRRGRTASRSRSAPRTRSSSSTPPARPASRRASSTPPAAISSTPRSPTSMSSTTTTATSTGAPPTSAGSPATATSSTGRWRTGRRR